MNNVCLICVCKESTDAFFRKIEYALPCYNDDEKDSQEIYARYWANHPDTRFTTLPAGTRLAIRGHLDVNKKFGTIIIVESYELLR